MPSGPHSAGSLRNNTAHTHVNGRWVTEPSLSLLLLNTLYFNNVLPNSIIILLLVPHRRSFHAERQLSLPYQCDGAGHTSGSPWQRRPLPCLLQTPSHPPQLPPLYIADRIKIFCWLLHLLKKQSHDRTLTLRGALLSQSFAQSSVKHFCARGGTFCWVKC